MYIIYPIILVAIYSYYRILTSSFRTYLRIDDVSSNLLVVSLNHNIQIEQFHLNDVLELGLFINDEYQNVFISIS